MHIRRFQSTDAEYATVVAVANACWPRTPGSVAEWQHTDQVRAPRIFHERWVVEHNGQIIGVGSCEHDQWAFHPDRYLIFVNVHPEHRGQGAGRRLYEHLVARLAPRDPAVLEVWTAEDHTAALAFLKKRGYVEVMRENLSQLDVTAFDPARFQPYIDRAKAHGIAIYTLAELLASDDAAARKLYDLDFTLMADVPAPEPVKPIPFEEWRRHAFESPDFDPTLWLVAVDPAVEDATRPGYYVGESALWLNLAQPERLYNGLTGTRREYRRRGIATAVKVAAISAAQARGATAIITGNEENNPMYTLNVMLGFTPIPAEVVFEKRLRDPEPPAASQTDG